MPVGATVVRRLGGNVPVAPELLALGCHERGTTQVKDLLSGILGRWWRCQWGTAEPFRNRKAEVAMHKALYRGMRPWTRVPTCCVASGHVEIGRPELTVLGTPVLYNCSMMAIL